MKKHFLFLRTLLFLLCFSIAWSVCAADGNMVPPKQDFIMSQYQDWFFLNEDMRSTNVHNAEHYKNYAGFAPGYNVQVLQGIDKVSLTALSGGGYYIGAGESPLGYPLLFNGVNLLEPPRRSSYCSGACYGAFIEALNLIDGTFVNRLSAEQMEAMRMQEPDGARRHDDVKMWGYWNDDNWGVVHALVEYARVGQIIKPNEARPGDFMKIMWTKGYGHFVIFLGWVRGEDNVPIAVRYWSSQTGTNGYGEQESSLSAVKSMMLVRLVNPERLTEMKPDQLLNVLAADDTGYVLR